MTKWHAAVAPHEGAESPREWSNSSTMYCWHRRYTLGDAQPTEHPYGAVVEALNRYPHRLTAYRLRKAGIHLRRYRTTYGGWNEEHPFDAVERAYEASEKGMWEFTFDLLDALGAAYLPLSLYDHSGITMSTGSPSCRWDSGWVGFILADDPYPKRKDRDDVLRRLKGEVTTYDHYLTGNVWGFRAFPEHAPDEEDSCWGFYGDPDEAMRRDMADHFVAEGDEVVWHDTVEEAEAAAREAYEAEHSAAATTRRFFAGELSTLHQPDQITMGF